MNLRCVVLALFAWAVIAAGCSDDAQPQTEPSDESLPGDDTTQLPDDSSSEGDTVDDPTDPSTPDDEPADYAFQTEFGNADTLEVVTDGIFAIWWYPQFDHAEDAVQMFAQLQQIRRDCLDNLGMMDPPNPAAGFYYNVYIHHGAEDDFPEGWANGQGTDSFGMPFLTLPQGAHTDVANLYHEGFHIFQYQANAPGFAYAGDSQWYIESAAQWYLAKNLPGDENAFIEAGAISANPHLALWHSFSNQAPGDPTDWLFQVRQYGMHTYLFYLTSQASVDPDIISGGFYSGTFSSPQRYHYEQVGAENLRGYFADWAAHNTAGFDYLTPGQVARAQSEVDNVGDQDNLHPYVVTLRNTGTNGAWFRPQADLMPRGWSYNVIRIETTQAATYSFTLDADELGSEQAVGRYAARVVVKSGDETSYSQFEMTSPQDGSASVFVSGEESTVYVIVAAVPENFEGNQTYGYSLKIDVE